LQLVTSAFYVLKKEDIFTIPNLLSTLRILAAPVLGYLIVTGDYASSIALFGVAGLTDMLDGFIARNFANQKSVLGTVLDPFADKILMSVVTVSLTVVSLLPVALTALILSRDAVLVSCAFYFRYKSLPSPVSLVGCNKYRKMNHSDQNCCSSHKLVILFVIIV
ncbi:cardiolipin synthase (CMP-forming)-like, partial [Orbicella faveolata]|uniref:cardiolipin synthase (CMP-forming)-like n=1 Tax=Orbicella faveolata TaxID=48498 RepID=UPI0009E397BD